MADYRLTDTSAVIDTRDGSTIPNVAESIRRQTYEAWLVAGGVPDPSVGPSLATIKADLRARVDAMAGAERAKYITVVPGQSEVYEAKKTEVARWRNAGEPADPSAALYRWAADRAVRLGVTIAAVLAEWVAQADAWTAVGIAIENVREGAKDAIAAAETLEAAQAIFNAIEWPEPL